jgi:putative aldouronate transport system substrate-binding protein
MKRVLIALLAISLAATAFGAPTKITIMTSSYSTDPVKPDADAFKLLCKLADVDLMVNFVNATTGALYTEKMNLTMASGEMPMVMLALERNAAIFNAIRQGAFWEIGPYLKDYPNLKQASDIVLWNSSFDGKYYGLYRGRPLGRNGVIYRSDWLKNVGMSEPKTVDEFYRMLKAFAEKDPDKNGKNDTYGMAMTKYMGPFDQIVTWLGGPNGWGKDASGKLVPVHMTKEYKDALVFFKKLYDEKLINEDFAVFDPGKWSDLLITGKAGVVIDVTDRANKINDEFERSVPGAYMEIMSPPAGPKGQRSLATAGFAGVFLFSKEAIKDVATLKKVLAFFDKLGDKNLMDLCGYGIEGVNYKLVDGRIDPLTAAEATKLDLKQRFDDMNQLLPFIPNLVGTPLVAKPWRVKGDAVQAANAKFVVGDPCFPFTSPTMALKATQLKNIIEDARIKYIIGQIDDKGWDEAVESWKKTGGDQVIKEFNDEYSKYAKK